MIILFIIIEALRHLKEKIDSIVELNTSRTMSIVFPLVATLSRVRRVP